MALSKYETNILPHLDEVKKWVEADVSEEEIAKRLDVSYSRFRDYKTKYSALSAALKKELSLKTDNVVGSLYQNAIGGTVEVRKQFKLKRKIYNEAGKIIKEEEYLETGVEDVYVKPDTVAQMYWLNNRSPGEWRARPEAKEEMPEIPVIIDDIPKEGKEYDDKEADTEQACLS